MDPDEASDTASSVAAAGDSDEYDDMDDPQWCDPSSLLLSSLELSDTQVYEP